MKAEKGMSNALDYYRALDVIFVPVLIVDNDNKHLFTNHAYKQEIGYPIDKVHNKDTWFKEVYPDPQYRQEIMRQWKELLEAASRSGEPSVHLEARMKCDDGRYVWYDIHQHQLEGKRIVTFINVDRMRAQNEQLLRALKFSHLLNASLVHDIRSPMATLHLLLKLNDKFFMEPAAQLKHHFDRVSRQLNRVFDVIDSSLLHQADALDGFKFKKEQIFLESFVTKVLTYYEEDILESSLTIERQIDEGLRVQYDVFILEVILRNIMSNAIKYSPASGKVTLQVQQTPHYCDIAVIDEGEGMFPEQLARITRPLNDPEQPGRKSFNNGFGLGLMMAKELLESHFGKLLVESEKNAGSVFTIRIPAYIPVFPDAAFQQR